MAEAGTIYPPLGAGIPALRYRSCENSTSNFSLAFCINDTNIIDDGLISPILTEVVAIVVPLLFGIIVFVGLIGNALVSSCQQQSFVTCLF
jgi:hypothetical protein